MIASVEKHVNKLLSGKLGLQISSLQFRSVGGGSINDTYEVAINHSTRVFLKTNSVSRYPALFLKEKNGLEFLRSQKVIEVPSVIACDENSDDQILLLEWIDNGLKSEKFWEHFGESLAALHHVTASQFGFAEDNYMGALPQPNNQEIKWIDFFIHHRLDPQIEIAKTKGLLSAKQLDAFRNVYPKLGNIFGIDQPSLVHGDLWSGNFICGRQSRPVLIDPAIYFGHRSVDLAMTTLFGGFDKKFYESYNYYFPFPHNHTEQWDLCNLYPLLIHLNLFGSGYLSQIESILIKFR